MGLKHYSQTIIHKKKFLNTFYLKDFFSLANETRNKISILFKKSGLKCQFLNSVNILAVWLFDT